MAKKAAPSVNAGSMADIAFLLLIFFLVTTTIETDRGISRRLPPPPELTPPEITIKKKNIFKVELNELNEILVEGAPMQLKELKESAVAFLDNGGGINQEFCEYCQGTKDAQSSDHPNKAVISLRNSRKTNYATYVAVQNELVGAYTQLRNREAKRLYGVSFLEMKKNIKDPNYTGDKRKLKEQIKIIKTMYPEKLSEAEPS